MRTTNQKEQKQTKQLSLNFTIQNFNHGCYYVYTYVTSSAKIHHVCTTTEFNFIIPAYRYNQWLPIPSVSIMLHINWSASLEVILPTLQSHDLNNGTNGGYQLGLGLLLLPLWPTNKAWAIVWAPTGIIAAPRMPQLVPAAHPTCPLCKLY